MDANDCALIEEQLNVVLPKVFRHFMMPFPNDTTHQLLNDCNALPCSSELFVVGQFQRFFNPEGYDYYELQPELKSHRFIEVGGDGLGNYAGGDGCGNYFCMVGDDADSDELWMWVHDPYDGFLKCDESLSDFLENGKWELKTCPDPFLATTGTYIVRADHPVRAILNPVALSEWLHCVERQDFLELDENHICTNPFTQKKQNIRRWPGRVKMLVDASSRHISYLHGALSVGENLSAEAQSLVERIAADLDAVVWAGK